MLLNRCAKVAVLLPPSPTLRELFAAEELKKYLTAMLGFTFAAEAPVRFVIGDPYRNPAAAEIVSPEEYDSLLVGDEGLLVRVKGDAVLLTGSHGRYDEERGTLYATYEFLERLCGCSLSAIGNPAHNVGEFVPTLDSLTLPEGDIVKGEADLPYRCAIVQYGDRAGDSDHGLNIPFLDWLVKNRYNRILTWCETYEKWKKIGLLPEIERRGLRLTVGHHDAVKQWLPFFGNEYFPEKYYETHPEYYRLEADGSRFRPIPPENPAGQWVFCSRNEGCIETVSENLIRWIGDNPLVDVIALWPMDGRFDQCACPACAKYSKIENYAYFQNEVAVRVAKVYPRIKMDMLLYTNLWECPDGMKLSPSLFCDMSTWAATGLRPCGKPDGSCLANTHFTETLLKWKAHGSEVAFYDYYMTVFGDRQRLTCMADELQSIWKYCKENGILGSGTQIECFNLWNYLVNLYAFARTGYDTSLTLDDHLAALAPLFGDGAPMIAEITRYLEELVDGQGPLSTAADYLNRYADKEKVYALFDEALAAAKTPRARNNIRLMRMEFRYSDLEPADKGHGQPYDRLLEYEDKTGELAYMAVNFDSFDHYVGEGIAFPLSNRDTKGFVPDTWYLLEQ
ncbi:MAG: DUF4838 domain-containing protein [Clostridia bacterium]|nr:DUF4838 domain-containing protein [Clostridia bacterium]